MHARSAPLLGLVVALGLALLGSCSSSKDDDKADATLPPTSVPTTATTTTPADPFAIPEVIDEAYVNKVLAALDQVDGDALRRVVATGGIDSEVPTILRAIYNDPQFQEELDGLTRVLERGLESFKNPPGNRKTIVDRLVAGSADCILVEARTDSSAVLKSVAPEPANEVEIFTLRRTQPGADPADLNPTPWSVANAEVIEKGAVPEERALCGA